LYATVGTVIAAWFVWRMSGGGPWPVVALMAGASVAALWISVPDDSKTGLNTVFRLAAALAYLVGTVSGLEVRRRRAGVADAFGALSALLLFVVGVTLVVERMPGQRMSHGGRTQTKGTVPHRTLGVRYLPHSAARTFYPLNPRGYFREPDPASRTAESGPAFRAFSMHVQDGGSVARLEEIAGNPRGFRAAIARAVGDVPWYIQINRRPHSVRQGIAYRLSFRVRADAPRTVSFGITQWHEPWRGLGFYRTIQVDTAWQTFDEVFQLDASDTSARLHIDLGGQSPSVDLSEIALRTEANGNLVEWANPNKYAISYRFNSSGCRGPDFSADERARRILVLGDSYTLGMGVKEDDTFAVRLEQLLATWVAGDDSMPARVLNCGVTGYGTRGQRMFYDRLSRSVDADVVLLVMTRNDDRLEHDEAPAWNDQPIVLSPPSYLMRRLMDETNRRIRSDPPASYADMRDELLRLSAATARRNAQLVVAVFRDSDHEAWDRLRDTVASVLGTTGTPVIDLGPALRGRAVWEALAVAHPVDVHPNEIAHRIVADTLATFLGQRGVLASPAGASRGRRGRSNPP
jgi:hypothetical protein